MNLIVKQASAYTSDELAAIGCTGIPANWPIESYEYTGQDIPDGFTQMADTDLDALKATNQSAYDAWITSLEDPLAEAKQKVTAAIAFGQSLLIQFSAESGTWNLTTDQVSTLAQELAPIQGLLLSGALGTAQAVLNSITPDEVMTSDIISKYSTLIQNYLDLNGD